MIPAGNHTDLIWPLSLIPRKWTAVESTHPPIGVTLEHSSTALGWQLTLYGTTIDVPDHGTATLALSRYGFMVSVNSHGWLFRIGTFRYDYVDQYYEFPTLTLKRHK